MFQSENGLLGVGEKPKPPLHIDERVINAGGGYAETVDGACFMIHRWHFTFILMRGGHIDATSGRF